MSKLEILDLTSEISKLDNVHGAYPEDENTKIGVNFHTRWDNSTYMEDYTILRAAVPMYSVITPDMDEFFKLNWELRAYDAIIDLNRVNLDYIETELDRLISLVGNVPNMDDETEHVLMSLTHVLASIQQVTRKEVEDEK